jgi:hypothetical protein
MGGGGGSLGNKRQIAPLVRAVQVIGLLVQLQELLRAYGDERQTGVRDYMVSQTGRKGGQEGEGEEWGVEGWC